MGSISINYDNLGQVVSPVINGLSDLLGSYIGGNFGNMFSSGLTSAGNTILNNTIKRTNLLEGVSRNTGESLAGAGVGLASNYIGQGINSLGGNSMLSRGIGQGISTGLGTLGGAAVSNLFKGSSLLSGFSPAKDSAKAFLDSYIIGKTGSNVATKAGDAAKLASTANLAGLGMSIVGTGLSAAFGPSKEYGGKYGNITRTMDTAYDAIQAGVGFVPGVGTAISGAMALNKGLSNIFGSTSGMCVCAGTKIFTATGDVINIEDLLLEQGIIGWDENSHNILPNTIAGIIEPKLKECLEIELKNGTILRCSIDHPILSNIKEKAESHRINGKRIAYREWSFRRADELQVGNWIGLANNIDYWGIEEMPNAYLIGMLIGDGTYTYESSCKLWTADPSTWKYLEENNLAVLIGQYTPENSNGKYSIENRDYRIINGMQLVKDLGIAYLKGQEKTLPKNIGKYNKDSICKLIAGLYDTDGSFSVNEEKGDYKITLYQSNLELLENLKLILQKLGIFATIYTRKASINKMSNGRIINSNQSYRLEVTDRNSIINFYKNIPLNIDYKNEHLERIYKLVLPKLDKDHCDLSGAKLYKIVSIKHIGIQTVYNLEASETHTYLANGIITHNTKQDAILGSAFMPAPVKWLNMAGAKTTGTFDNLSWLNTEKAQSFMGNSFGNLWSRFDKAGEEAGKTYGTFSRGAYNKALDNLNFANTAWNKILAMSDLNILQNIRSEYMSSINNLRYAQNIQGGFRPLARGKQGMKILNNATNHNIGQRLLSGAALIDNKQIILSAQGGTKLTRLRAKQLPKKSTSTYAPNAKYGMNGKPYEQWASDTRAAASVKEWVDKQPQLKPMTMSSKERAIAKRKGDADALYAQKQDLQQKGVNALITLGTFARPSSWAALPFRGIEHFGEGFGTEWVNTPLDLALPLAWQGAVNTANTAANAWRYRGFNAGNIPKGLLANAEPLIARGTPQITAENAANITPAQWTVAQDAAIARGDIAEAQRLRDLHFKVSALDADLPIQYHGSDSNLGNTVEFRGYNDPYGANHPFYTSSYKEYADGYHQGDNHKLYSFYINENSANLAKAKKESDFIRLPKYKVDNLIKEGYKGTLNNHPGLAEEMGVTNADEITVFNPQKYKLTDAVTYDNNGVRIPLGERDNFNINDIRYSWLPWFLGGSTAATLYNKSK